MGGMMTGVFTQTDRLVTRRFFTHFVSGRGCVPAIRIADQPYGILPVSTFRNLNWLENPIAIIPGFGVTSCSNSRSDRLKSEI